jgi:hypothetical protein
MREDYDFSRIEPDPLKAIAKNFLLDPVNVVPFSGYPKAVKAISAAGKARAIAGVRKVPILKKAVDEVGELFIRDYHAKHVLGMPELSELRTEHAKKLRELLVETKDARSREIEQLLPRYEERRKVFRLLEEPLDGTSKEWRAWKQQMDALDPNEQEAWRGRVGKGGIVRDPSVHRDVLVQVAHGLVDAGLPVTGVISSPITGHDGNREFLALIERGAAPAPAETIAAVVDAGEAS